MTSRSRLRLIAALVVATTVLGCSRREPAPPAAAPAAPALTKVTLQLNWFPETEHGGYYHAQAAGIYREFGLDVEIVKGGPKTPVEVQTATGRADFGIANADKILTTRVEGVPLVGLLAPYQVFPRCIIVHDASPVTSLAELKNCTLVANQTAPFLKFMQHTFGLEGVKVIPYQGGMSSFLANPDHAIQGYITSEPLIVQRHGIKPRSFLLADAGYNPYASVLITSEQTLAQRRDLVQRMVAASQRGWQEYLAAPAQANAIIRQLNPEMDDETLTYGAEHLKDLMLTAETAEFGFGIMTEARWTALRDQLLACGVLTRYPEPVAKAFTTEFLARPAALPEPAP